jgi:hypothetical protein
VSKTKKFDIKDNDYFAFDIAKHTACRLLKHPHIKPMQVIGLGKALYSLERLPLATEGICCEFGLVYRSGTEEFNKIKYINFKKFCNSITELEFMKVINAITNEISTTDQIEDSAKKKDSYLEDLMVLLRLFTSTTFPKNEVRANFISDAYSLLRKLESTLMSVKSMNLVKIADVYYTQTDETYYVFKKDYDGAYEYIADNKEQTKKLLSDDEWHCIGKIGRWDNVLVEAYSKGNKIIAIWDDIT